MFLKAEMSASPQVNAVWAELSRRGIGIREMASALGYHPHFVTLIVNNWATNQRPRRRIEAFLLIPIWSRSAEFVARIPRIKFFGADPEALTNGELVELCARHGLLSRRKTGLSRADLLKRIDACFKSLNPSPS